MKERLERALGIALDRAKREMRALIGRADNPPVIALALDRMAAEVDPVAEPARALNAFDRHLGLDRLASWADVQRVLNALEAVEEAEGIRHVSISAPGRILASEHNEELMEEGGSDPFAQDQVVRQALQRLGLPVNLIGPLLRRVVRYLPLGAIVETAGTGDWWVLSRWGVSWTSTPIHPMAFVRAGYPPRIAELLYKGQEISEEAVKAERLLMRLQELGYEVTVWPEPRDSSLESWEWIAMALVDGVEVAEAWGTNHDEAIVALARELGHAEAAD